MNKLYMGTNTKMYKNREETVEYIRELREWIPQIPENMELFLIPSFTSLESADRALQGSGMVLGAQNMGWEERGAYTGEISPLMLKETGVKLVEIGHSERRHILGETDGQENRKVLCALKNDLKVLLCVGETAEEKDGGMADAVLRSQISAGLRSVPVGKISGVMIAYEPVWAIGEQGTPPEAGYIRQRHAALKEILGELYGKAGRKVPILYGGSVNEKNAETLIAVPYVDGLFIGRSAWDAERFYRIIVRVYQKWCTLPVC